MGIAGSRSIIAFSFTLVLIASSGCEPDISVSPEEMTFGFGQYQHELTISNVGSAALEVYSVELQDGTGPFSVPPYDGILLSGESALPLTVEATPAADPADDVIVIESSVKAARATPWCSSSRCTTTCQRMWSSPRPAPTATC